MIRSGSCESSGCNMVKGREECEEASRLLDMKDQSANVTHDEDRPHGCTYTDQDDLMWYPLDSLSNQSEPRKDPLKPCGSKDDGIKSDCICRAGGITLQIVEFSLLIFNYFSS